MDIVQLTGYAAAALVVLSFLIGNNIKRIRIVNMAGAILFVIYGFLLGKNLPVIIPNFVIVLVQAYYLFIKKEQARG